MAKNDRQPELQFPREKGRKLDVSALESWLWEAACVIRGPLDAPKFKDYILPLVFLKRLSDVFDDEIGHLAQEFGDKKTTAKLVEQDHKLVRFFIPPKARWSAIAEKTTGLGEHLTDAVPDARFGLVVGSHGQENHLHQPCPRPDPVGYRSCSTPRLR
jgi:hypothetical protein